MSEEAENLANEREGRELDFSGKPSQFVSPSMLAEALRRGWQVTPTRKSQYFAALDDAIRNLGQIEDTEKRSRIAAQCARVLVAEQGQALRDIHHIEQMQHESGILDLRMRRAEEGKPNDCLAIQMTPVRELPLPPGLAEYRRKLLEPSNS